MFIYEKKLQYPVKIARPNPRLASIIISQYGGPDGELGASLRYLSQRYSMPFDELKGLLTDIGTEELDPRCYIYHPRQNRTGHPVRFFFILRSLRPAPAGPQPYCTDCSLRSWNSHSAAKEQPSAYTTAPSWNQPPP